MKATKEALQAEPYWRLLFRMACGCLLYLVELVIVYSWRSSTILQATVICSFGLSLITGLV